jgi:hypothetical protein
MAEITATEYWVQCLTYRPNNWKNAITGDELRIPTKADLSLRVGFFTAASTPAGLASVASLIAEVKPMDTNGTRPESGDSAVMSKTVLAAAFENDSITKTNFDSQTDAHVEFAWTDDETNLTLSDADAKPFWLVVSAVLDDGKVVPLGWGKVIFVQTGSTTGASTPDPIAAEYVTTTQLAAYLATANSRPVVTLNYFGDAVATRETSAYAPVVDETIVALQASAQVAPVGDALTIELYVEDTATGETVSIAAGATFGTATISGGLDVDAADVVHGRITNVGSTTAGGYVTLNLITKAIQN